MTTADWAQVASALFTALAAAAAFASVFRVERDRWRRTIPELHIEVLADVPNQEMRMTVVNLAAPAREVRVMGTIGTFGFVHMTPPSTYWRSGESRTYRISMPVLTDEVVYAFVEGRDLGKRQVVLVTVGGASYRWPLRRARQLSAAKEWERLFPGQAGPLDVQYTPMAIELIERNL